ncbi:PREDICTED: toll-interacting protein-like [Rhagoletis zephyria]|uniref:toll-interacting protein-like n=1 Tax=Rhagoletis zephyria TaxID=28612 RepID=UPI0008114F20|nr:PREDICTED: toll-interacting protein-like [Rhagoletis zephyria]XP_036321399.1 toll-interacting protein-like [Rhagoletis pomonella]
MANADIESRSSRWRKAMVGPLPNDFLRINNGVDPQVAADCQAATAVYQQQAYPQYVAPNYVGRLSITCAQAKLARNYGLTRMDPYVRIRVGHYVYETQTDPNGGKHPHWNRVIQSQLAAGVNSIFIEIYDECSFKMDELIAWCEIKIPQSVMRGETHEEWYPLSGKQGEGLEGAIDIVLSFSNQPMPPYMYPSMGGTAQMLMVPPGRPMPIFVTPQQPAVANTVITPAPPRQLSEEELKQIHEMFPNIDKEVVKSVFEANHGNKDATINSLLQMNE